MPCSASLLALVALCGDALAPPPRFAFVGPLTGPLAPSAKESLLGTKAALEGAASSGLLELDDGDDPKRADAAFEAARAKKVEAIVAAATGVTVDVYAALARKHHVPLVLVGSAGPATLSIAPDDGVLWLGTSTAEQVITLGTFLELPGRSKQPAFVIEETARGRDFQATLERNLAAHFQFRGVVLVPPHAPLPADAVAQLQAAGADRLVVVGEPDLVDATAAAIDALQWPVPLFLADGLASAAATCLFEKGVDEKRKGWLLIDGHPLLHQAIAPELAASWKRDAPDAPLPPTRARRAFDATRLFLAAAAPLPKKARLEELVAALRNVRYGDDESGRPVLDPMNRSARHQWLPWKLGAKGPEADDPSLWYDPAFGPLLRARPLSIYHAEPNTKVVWISFGDATSKAVRSIESDLTALGLITHGYEAKFDEWVLEELLARTIGKLHKLFLRNEDGTAIPGVSFAISFTTTKPDEPAKGAKEGDCWRAVIAGDDAEAGGRAWPGEGRCEIYSTFMRRTIFQKDALKPPVGPEDKRFLDGRYVWGTSSAENLRVKTIRCLIDGYAGSFALTGAHELGHIIGLDHDTDDPTSIMNVVEGAGLSEHVVCWIPKDLEIMERVLGRVGVEKPKKKR